MEENKTYAYSNNHGYEYHGEYDSEKEALKAAIDDISDCDKFVRIHIGIFQKSEFKPKIDVDDVFEAIQEQANNEGRPDRSDDYLDYVTVTQMKELEENLNKALEAWIEKHNLKPDWNELVGYNIYHYENGDCHLVEKN